MEEVSTDYKVNFFPSQQFGLVFLKRKHKRRSQAGLGEYLELLLRNWICFRGKGRKIARGQEKKGLSQRNSWVTNPDGGNDPHDLWALISSGKSLSRGTHCEIGSILQLLLLAPSLRTLIRIQHPFTNVSELESYPVTQKQMALGWVISLYFQADNRMSTGGIFMNGY